VQPSEIHFTSGATESNNIAIDGAPIAAGQHVIASAIEHKSVALPVERLRARGVEVTILKPDREGFITADHLRAALRENTVLVTVMAANGEIGTIEPIAELAAICHERRIRFHTDATQAAGKVPLDFCEIPAGSFAISAHKFYGPKGIGVLFLRRGLRVEPLTVGGGQERNVRSGTVNVPGAVGMAAALEICAREMKEEGERLTAIRNRLWDRVAGEIGDTSVSGPRQNRLPGNLNVSFGGTDSEALMMAMRRFSLSSGAACSSGSREVSPVLRAIGRDDAHSAGSIRFGLGRSTTTEHIDLLVADLKKTVSRLREMSVA
jgi:cysteine desulfurase